MDRDLFERLARLPSLDPANRQVTQCKVCGGRAEVFDVVDFNKCCSEMNCYAYGLAGVPISYFRCLICGFMFTRFFDDWAPDEFAKFIYNADYIKVDGDYAGPRPEREAEAMAGRLSGLQGLDILDYGSGSGHFAQDLRARGFESVASYDPFSSPDRPDRKFDLLTCFEVLEHTTSPEVTVADMASLLREGGCVIFSTGLQPSNIGQIRASWWYVGPRNGHASVFTLEALAALGEARGLTLYAGKDGIGFATPNPSAASKRLLESVGRPFRFWQLTAPDAGAVLAEGQAASWHGVEGAGDAAYRWTRGAEITWRLQDAPVPPCRLKLAIAFRIEVESGFADRCRIKIGERSLPVFRGPETLSVEVELEEPFDGTVTLITPPPVRPRDLRPVSDTRPLGLAVPTRSAMRVLADQPTLIEIPLHEKPVS
jgi:SAM-dependent methyltransferase